MMLEYLLLLVSLFRTVLRSRADLVAENLLLRQQLTVLSRPTRRRPRLRSQDKLFWVFIRTLRATGVSISSSCDPIRWSVGIVTPGNCSGAGAPATGWAVHG